MKKTLTSNNSQETIDLAYQLGLKLKERSHVTVLLDGTLGAGKTTFAKGLALAYGVKEIVNSPTFTILKSYQTDDINKTFYHLDLYRLNNIGLDFDLEDYMKEAGIVVVEWPYQVKELLPSNYLLIKFIKTNENSRIFEISEIKEQKR